MTPDNASTSMPFTRCSFGFAAVAMIVLLSLFSVHKGLVDSVLPLRVAPPLN
jgi:hypothetical protein